MINYSNRKVTAQCYHDKDNIDGYLTFSYNIPFRYDFTSDKKTLLGKTIEKVLDHEYIKDLPVNKFVLDIK